MSFVPGNTGGFNSGNSGAGFHGGGRGVGGGGGYVIRPAQQQQQQQMRPAPGIAQPSSSTFSSPPPPLRPAHVSNVNATIPREFVPVFAAEMGGRGRGTTTTTGPAWMPQHTTSSTTMASDGVGAPFPPKHVDATANLPTGSSSGCRSMGSAAPFTHLVPTDSYYGNPHPAPKPQQQQQQQQQPPPAGRSHLPLTGGLGVASTSASTSHPSAYTTGGGSVSSGFAHWRGGGPPLPEAHAQRRRSGSGRSGTAHTAVTDASLRARRPPPPTSNAATAAAAKSSLAQSSALPGPSQRPHATVRPRGGGGSVGAAAAAAADPRFHDTHAMPPEHFTLASDPPPFSNTDVIPIHVSSVPSAASPPPPLPSVPVSGGVRRGSATSAGSATGARLHLSGQPPQYPQAQGFMEVVAHPNVGGGGRNAIGAVASSSSSPPPSQPTQLHALSVNKPAVPAVSATGTAAAATVTRPIQSRDDDRPTVALSQNIMSVYQTINEIFYEERQRLLGAAAAAPAKNAERKYEDTSGHYVPCDGEVIADRYIYKGLVGQGSFGKVLHCIDRKYDEPVAVKVIRSGPYFESQGWFEAQVVAHLNNDPALQNLVVQLRKVFLWKNHIVLVFEPLSFSLYKLITLTKHNGVSLDLTRKFAYQMVKVLLVLEQHQPPIIHCDLKPENVLLRDPSRSGVRVIDFGSACYQQQAQWTLPPTQVALPPSSPSASPGLPCDANVKNAMMTNELHDAAAATRKALGTDVGGGEVRGGAAADTTTSPPPQRQQQGGAAMPPGADTVGNQEDAVTFVDATAVNNATLLDENPPVEVIMPKYIQSRYYRSPEVILELGYTTAIDRWSLGCFLVEMHTGRPLFQGNNEADMIAYFTLVLGTLPDYMIAASPKRTRLYHTCVPDGSSGRGGTDGSPHVGISQGTTTTAEAAAAAQSLLVPHQQQQQPQQRAASPLLAFTASSTSPPPGLSPFTEAPGHTAGSPFFLRAPHVECAETSTAEAVTGTAEKTTAEGGDKNATPLEKVLGVHSGGPRGCRAGQPGHDEASYEVFCDFIARLLQYDPRKRMSCEQAILHPFLEPIRALEARAADAGGSTSTPPPHLSSSSAAMGCGDGGDVEAAAADAAVPAGDSGNVAATASTAVPQG